MKKIISNASKCISIDFKIFTPQFERRLPAEASIILQVKEAYRRLAKKYHVSSASLSSACIWTHQTEFQYLLKAKTCILAA